MKKNWWLFLILAVLFLLGGFFVVKKVKKSQEGPTPTPTPEGVLIESTLEERPYVTLTPRVDGREMTLSISQIKNADSIEYELVYLSNDLSRGVIGTIHLNSNEKNISRNLLLGTCSRNVCKYDENVTEGTLTLRFRDSDGVRKFITDFHLQQGDEILSSKDGHFQVEGKFSPTVFYLTMSTMGLPEEIEGQTASEIYGVFTVGNKTIKNGVVTLALVEESPTASLYSWDGKVWQSEKKNFETDGKTLSASTAQLATFLAVIPK